MSLGNWGQSWQNWLDELFATPYVRDFTHSAKVFRENSYELSPKQKFLFHTYFDINPNALQAPLNERPINLLVKEVKLPAYKFDVKEMNQYNRKRLIQTKINYDPVQITFHDDTAGIMTEMWHAYYTYYYADGRKVNANLGNQARGNLSPLVNGGPVVDVGSLGVVPLQSALQRTQYQNINAGEGDWGYIGENFYPEPDPIKQPFFNKITIFGFAQHMYMAYTLINPIITDFAHDTYDYNQGNGIMQNTMTIAYETVVYNQGSIDGTAPGDIAVGFGQEGYYDRDNSPLTPFGTNGKVWGQNGLVDGLGGFVDNLLGGDPLLAATDLARLKLAYGQMNIGKQSQKEFEIWLQQYYRNASNNTMPRGSLNFKFPTPGGPSPAQLDEAGQNLPGVIYEPMVPVEDPRYYIPPPEEEFVTILPVNDDVDRVAQVLIIDEPAGTQYPDPRGVFGARFAGRMPPTPV